jgi:hypothetical protein
MAISNLMQLGTYITGQPLIALINSVTGKKYVFQVIETAKDGSPKKGVPRGKATLLSAGSSTRLSTVSEADLSGFEESASGTDGNISPASFVMPNWSFSYSEADGTPVWTNTNSAVEDAKDTNGDGIVDSNDVQRSATVFDQVQTFVKANMTYIIIAVLVYVYIKSNQTGKKKKSFLGIL